MNVKITNLEHLVKVLGPDLVNKPLADFFKRLAVTVQSNVRPNVPVDTGQARNEVQYEIDKDTPPMSARVGWLGARVGSDKWFKVRAIEFGTARQGDPEVSHKSSHFPPGYALDTWARRHGGGSAGRLRRHLHVGSGPGDSVAAAIGRRGGLKAKRPLRTGLKGSLSDIRGLIKRLGDEIGKRW